MTLEQNKFLLFYSHNNKGFFFYVVVVFLSFFSYFLLLFHSILLFFCLFNHIPDFLHFNTMLNFLPHLYQTYSFITFSGVVGGAKVLGKLSY